MSDKGPLPTDEQVEQWAGVLAGNGAVLEYLANRGISVKTVERYRLGFDQQSSAITIPIYDEGALVNVRFWSYGQEARARGKFRGVKGRNQNRMFPDGPGPGPKVYVMEGEPDCLAALSSGLNAITFTSGATAAPAIDRLAMLKDREVTVLYDADDAGRKGAKKAAREIRRYTNKVKIIDPCAIGGEEGDDYTDCLSKVGAQLGERIVEAEAATEWDRGKVDNFHVVHDVGFSESIASSYINKIVRLTATVAGCSERPYSVFLRLHGQCFAGDSENPKCNSCPLFTGEREVDLTARQLLCQVDVRDHQLQKFYDHAIGARCGAWEITEAKSDRRSIYHVALSHNLDMSTTDPDNISSEGSMQLRSAWIVTDATGGPKINSSYDLIGQTVTSPVDQANVQVFTGATLTVNPVEQFKLTDEARQVIRSFHP